MDRRAFIEGLTSTVAPSASVVDVEESHDAYRVRVAGTTGVVARCELPRDDVEAADRRDDARQRVASALKRCADDVVAPVPDGRA